MAPKVLGTVGGTVDHSSEGKTMVHGRMHRNTWLSRLAWLVICLTVWSCSGDPTVRKRQHLQKGQEYLTFGQVNAAVIEFKNAIQIDPNFAEGYYALGLAYLKKGYWGEAAQQLERARSQEADLPGIEEYLAQAKLMVGALDEAHALAGEVIARDPQNSLALTVLGGVALERKSFDEARRYLHQAIESDPALAAPHIFLSAFYRTKGENARAQEEIEQALDLDEHNLQVLYALANMEWAANRRDVAQELYYRILEVDHQQWEAIARLASLFIDQENYEKARPLTERLIKSQPNLHLGYLLRGLIALRTKTFDKAAVDLQKASTLRPDDTQSHFYYGVALYQMGSLQQALSEFQTALQLNPDLTNVRLSAARIYAQTGLFNDAIRASQEVFEVRPNDPMAYYILGMAHLRQGELDTGYQALEQAIVYKPDFAQAYQGKGMYYQLKDELGQAIDAYETVLQMDPNQTGARALLILAHLRKKDFEAAITEANRGQELEPENPMYTNLLGVAYGMQDNSSQAERLFGGAIAQKSEFLAPRYNLAALYLSTGRPQKAEEEYQKILEVKPKNLKALMGLGQIYEREAQYDKALEVYQRAAQISKTLNIMLRLGWLQYRRGAFDEAAIAAENILAWQADHIGALKILGLAKAARGDLTGALESLRRVTNMESQDTTSWNLLGQVAYIAGQRDEAEEALQHSLAIKADQPLVAIQLALTQQDLDRVISTAEAELARRPDSARLRFILGQAYRRTQRFDEALRQFHEAARLDPSLWPARHNLAELYLLQGDVAKAKTQVEEVLARYSGNRWALTLSGALIEGQGKMEEARRRYGEAAKKRHLPAMLLLARSYTQSREFTKALNVASDAAHLYPNSPFAHEAMGLIYVATKEYEKALRAFKRYTELSPSKQVGLNRIAAIYTALGQYKNAANAYGRSLKLMPDQPGAQLGLSKVYLQQGQQDKALELAQRVLKDYPDMPQALHWMGNIYAQRRDYPKAIEYWTRVIEASPKALMVYVKVGFAHLKQGDRQKAMEIFQASIKENPEFGPGYISLGEAYKLTKQEVKASEMYEKGLTYSPRSTLALNNLAWIFATRGEQLDKALNLAKRAKDLARDSPEIADTLGMVYLKKGNYPLALTYFKEAVEGLPDNPTVRFHAGMAYAKLGNTKEAQAELKRSLDIDPNFGEAKEARDMLSKLSR